MTSPIDWHMLLPLWGPQRLSAVKDRNKKTTEDPCRTFVIITCPLRQANLKPLRHTDRFGTIQKFKIKAEHLLRGVYRLR